VVVLIWQHSFTATKTRTGSGKGQAGWPLAGARRGGAGGGRGMGTWRRRQPGTGRDFGRRTFFFFPPRLPPLLLPPSSSFSFFLLLPPSSASARGSSRRAVASGATRAGLVERGGRGSAAARGAVLRGPPAHGKDAPGRLGTTIVAGEGGRRWVRNEDGGGGGGVGDRGWSQEWYFLKAESLVG